MRLTTINHTYREIKNTPFILFNIYIVITCWYIVQNNDIFLQGFFKVNVGVCPKKDTWKHQKKHLELNNIHIHTYNLQI